MSASTQPPPSTLNVTMASLWAWVFPGLGHIVLGQRKRGAILCVTIMSLWIAGLLIGGIGVMNRGDGSEWFIRWGHRFMLPSMAAGMAHDRLLIRAQETGEATYVPSFANVKEQGTLYTGLAGFLNLLAILDVIYADHARRRLSPQTGADSDAGARSADGAAAGPEGTP